MLSLVGGLVLRVGVFLSFGLVFITRLGGLDVWVRLSLVLLCYYELSSWFVCVRCLVLLGGLWFCWWCVVLGL